MEISSVLHFLLTMLLIFSRTAANGQKHLVVTQPKIVTAEAGESVTITCSFKSVSPSYSVTWTVGCNISAPVQDNPCFQRRVKISTPDAIETPRNTQASSYDMKTTVTIQNLTENDSGMFCCHIKTAYGEAGTGPGSSLKITRRLFSKPAEFNSKMHLVVEIIHIICLIILIVLLGSAVKISC